MHIAGLPYVSESSISIDITLSVLVDEASFAAGNPEFKSRTTATCFVNDITSTVTFYQHRFVTAWVSMDSLGEF